MENLTRKETPITAKRCILALLNYFIGYCFVYPIIISIIFSILPLRSLLIRSILEWGVYLFVLVTTIIMLMPILKESWQNFISRPLRSFLMVFGFFLLMLVTNVLLSNVVSNITGLASSVNQEGINESLSSNLIQIAFAAVVFAPFVEELLFRGVLYRCINKKVGLIVATIISAFSFGLIHILESILTGNWLDCSYILVYAGMGAVLALCYEKTQSIWCCIFVHMIYNAFAVAITLAF